MPLRAFVALGGRATTCRLDDKNTTKQDYSAALCRGRFRRRPSMKFSLTTIATIAALASEVA